jgi:hypothetical protein
LRITKDNLDTPYTELIEGATNTETPRQFIRNTEKEFDMQWVELEKLSEDGLNEYIEFLDYLWTK